MSIKIQQNDELGYLFYLKMFSEIFIKIFEIIKYITSSDLFIIIFFYWILTHFYKLINQLNTVMKALHFKLYLVSYERVKSNFPKKSKLKWNIVIKSSLKLICTYKFHLYH